MPDNRQLQQETVLGLTSAGHMVLALICVLLAYTISSFLVPSIISYVLAALLGIAAGVCFGHALGLAMRIYIRGFSAMRSA